MATELDKLFKGFSIREIEDILFKAADGLKKTDKKDVSFATKHVHKRKPQIVPVRN